MKHVIDIPRDFAGTTFGSHATHTRHSTYMGVAINKAESWVGTRPHIYYTDDYTVDGVYESSTTLLGIKNLIRRAKGLDPLYR